MLNILLILCYSLSLIIILVLAATLLIKCVRSISEKHAMQRTLSVEPLVDSFITGSADFQELFRAAKNSSYEKTIFFLLLQRLSFLKDHDADKITFFLEKTQYMARTISLLTSKNNWKRAYAASVIGKTKSKKCIGNLLPLLHDDDITVIISTASALAKIGDISVITALIETIDRIDQSKAHAISDNLIELSSKNVSETFPQILIMLTSPADHVRYWGCVIIGELRLFDAIQKLQMMVRDNASLVRSAAIQALGKIGDPATYEIISFGLLDPDWHVRHQAAWALGELKYQAAIPTLARGLMDRQWEVNTQAVLSLRTIDRSSKSFVRLLDSDYPFVRLRAAESLEISGFIDKTIDELPGIPDEQERNKQVQLLKTCAENGARVPLYRNINNKNEIINSTVKQIIKEVTGIDP